MSLAQTDAAIYSDFADDPDFCELVEMFVEEIPERIETLQEAMQTDNIDMLLRTAHQLKGALGSYGFSNLSPLAAELESAVNENNSQEEVCQRLDALLDACGRMRAGKPNS